MINSAHLFLFGLALVLVGVTAPNCATTPDPTDIKVYFSRPDLGGIYRGQDEELIPYSETAAYRCLTPEHWALLLQKCTRPEDN